jgi:hypothetical protein
VQYRRVARERGVRARLWPWLAVAVIALGGGAATSRSGTDHGVAWLNIAGPFVVNALALLALAGFVRSRAIGIAAVTMLAISFIVAGTLSGDVAVAVQLAAYAAVLMVASAWIGR